MIKNQKDQVERIEMYGKETKKARDNFALGPNGTNFHLIGAMLDIKKAAAQTYRELEMMEKWKADAIIFACDELKKEKYRDNFCVHPLQGGAGTAIGLGDNASRQYRFRVIEKLRDLTGIGLARAEYEVDLTQNNDVFVEVSGLLKAMAVNLMKIAGDLRWMNSGPKGGLGEIILQEVQAGSTIMPGKVNPVIPEMVTQVAIKVMANDQAVATAAASGNFELNAFLPLIADSLLESLELLIRATELFRTKCIDTLRVNEAQCRKHLEGSLAEVTHKAVEIGYEKAAEEARRKAKIDE